MQDIWAKQGLRFYSNLTRSVSSTSSSFEFLMYVSIGGWHALVHHLETVVGAQSNCSANHLFVFWFSAKTTLIRLFSYPSYAIFNIWWQLTLEARAEPKPFWAMPCKEEEANSIGKVTAFYWKLGTFFRFFLKRKLILLQLFSLVSEKNSKFALVILWKSIKCANCFELRV